jgi:uncharacterized protein (TIGR02145 family)
MKILLIAIAIFSTLKSTAQTYLISFTATGASDTVKTVKVNNMTTGTTLTLKGDESLRLSGMVGINSSEEDKSDRMRIYPNPAVNYSFIEIFPPAEGEATIAVYDITGRQIFQTRRYFENSRQEFRFTGIRNGLYVINVKGDSYNISGKLLCTGQPDGTIRIEEVSNTARAVDVKSSKIETKGVQNIVDMAYTTGDRLKFTGISGIYSTVFIDTPVSDHTITFDFVACSDGDSNNYSVIKIGTQLWMAENLKTTKYNEGTAIPNITDNSTWSALVTPAYCFYNNDPANKVIYGALYNWYCINSNLLCPTGWHHPTSAEWTKLIEFLDGPSAAGSHLKETGTIYWTAPNVNSNNSSGFSALPAGVRMDTYLPWNDFGIFDLLKLSTWFTAYNEAGPISAYWLSLSSGSAWATLQNSSPKNTGFSVRCLKNQ